MTHRRPARAPRSSHPNPPRRRRLAVLPATAAALLVMSAPAAAAPAHALYSAFTTSAEGWTPAHVSECDAGRVVACTIDNSYTALEGTPNGSLKTAFSRVSPIPGRARSVASWTSKDFQLGSEPGTATLKIQRNASVGSLLSFGGDAAWRVRLINATTGTEHVAVDVDLEDDDDGFVEISAPVPVSFLNTDDRFRIEVQADLNAAAAGLVEANVLIDEVGLEIGFDQNEDVVDEDVADEETTTSPEPNAGPSPEDGFCAPVTVPRSSADSSVRLTAAQLAINQRIGQAAIRRVNAVERWLNQGIVRDDLCGGAIGEREAHSSLAIGDGPEQQLVAASPRPLKVAAPSKESVKFTVSRRQILINQRIYQAALLRGRALQERLAGNLTGGDIRAGQISHAKLAKGKAVLKSSGAVSVAPSTTKVESARRSDSGSVEMTPAQLLINQRVAQAAIRTANAVRATVQRGLRGDNFRAGSVAEDAFAPGARP